MREREYTQMAEFDFSTDRVPTDVSLVEFDKIKQQALSKLTSKGASQKHASEVFDQVVQALEKHKIIKVAKKP